MNAIEFTPIKKRQRLMTKPPIQLVHLPSRRSRKRNLSLVRGFILSGLAILATCLVLAGCKAESGTGLDKTAASFKKAAVSAWQCPGMKAIWLSENIVRCVREEP